MPEDVNQLLETNQTGSTSSAVTKSVATAEAGAIRALRFFAWMDLICGIIGWIWIWAEFGQREVFISYSSYHETNPTGIAIAFAVLLQGMFACALFLVIASIAENLMAIRRGMQPR